MGRLFLHSYWANEIWSVNYLHTQVTMKIKMSTLFENLFYASENNPAKFHAFFKKCTISLFFCTTPVQEIVLLPLLKLFNLAPKLLCSSSASSNDKCPLSISLKKQLARRIFLKL